MAPLIAYAARTGTRRNLAALRVRGWRLLVSAAGAHRTEGFEHYGLDNGAWSAYQKFLKGRAATPVLDKRRFIKLLLLLGGGADWAVACDIVMGGSASLALSLVGGATSSRRRRWAIGRSLRASEARFVTSDA